MTFNIRNAKDNGNGTYDCEIEHPEYGWIPFTATSYDLDEDGKDIFSRIHSGMAGEVAEYTPPSFETQAEIVREERNARLRKFDVELYRNEFYWNSLTQEQRNERLAYRQSLLDIPQQEGFPYTVVWPDFTTL